MPGEAPLRILLVTSDPEIQESMIGAFANTNFEIVGAAWPGIDATRRADTLRPDVVMLHIEEPIGSSIHTVEAIADACPTAGLAVVSSSTDLETVRRAMNAGAHDFAQLPLSDDAVRDAALRAARATTRRTADDSETHTTSPTGKVIAVVGPRGGVGKTTIAANLAIALARETGTDVAIADLDTLFGSAAIALDLMPEAGLQEWLHERKQRPNMPATPFLAEHVSGLRLLAAPTDPDPDMEFGATEVAELVTDLSSTHEFVVLDTPASFNEVTAAAIESSSFTLLVASPDLAALRATHQVIETLRAWSVPDERLTLALNHPAPILSVTHNEVRDALGLPVAWDLPHDTAVLRAAAAGVPVFDFKENAAFTREVREIARFFAGVSGRPRASRSKLLGVF